MAYERETIELVSFVAGILTTFSTLPQIIKSWRDKDVKSISLVMYIVLFCGVSTWSFVGFMVTNWAMTFWNAVSASLIFSVIVMKVRYHHKSRSYKGMFRQRGQMP